MGRLKNFAIPILGILVLVAWYLFFRPKLEDDAPFDDPPEASQSEPGKSATDTRP